MAPFRSIRRTILFAAACAAAPAGPAAPPAHAPQPATQQGGRAVMAYVDARPVYMDDLHDLLVRSHGPKAAHQLLAAEVVRRAAEKQQAGVAAQDLADEERRTLEHIFGKIADANRRKELLDQFLLSRGLSQAEWQLIIRRNALLRKLAAPRVRITEEEMQEHFFQKYGGKVRISLIERPTVTDAQQTLDALAKGGDFGKLAWSTSLHPSGKNMGRFPYPLGPRSTAVAPEIRSAATALKQVGDLSEIVKVGTRFVVVRLDEKIPPADVKLAGVRAELQAELAEHKVRLLRQQILVELLRRADIDYVNPVLRSAMEAAKADRPEGPEP